MKSESVLLAGSLLLNLAIPGRSQQVSLPGHAPFDFRPFLFLRPPSMDPGSPPVSDDLLKDYCRQLTNDRRRLYFLFDHRYRMSLQLKGVYTKEGMLFFRLLLSNRSHLDYDADSIRFFVMDNRSAKRPGPLMRVGLRPIYIYGDIRRIAGKSRQETIIVLPRFTLPEGKHLIIEVLEKNGGRDLRLLTDNTTLLRSRLI